MSFIKALPSILSKTAAYTVSTNDGDNVQVNTDATSGAVTITLYAASTNTGKIVTVKKTDSSANAVTIDGNASETIDGATTLVLAKQYDSATLTCNGTNWTSVAVAGQTYNGQTISSAANLTGTLAVAGLTTLSATGDHWNKGSLSLGPAQSASIGAGDLSVARSATTAYLNFGSNGTVNLALASSVLTLNGAMMTKPAQPAFLATAATQSNVTGDGTDYTITFTTEIFDQASNFSTSTFTAPVTGRYQLNTMIGLTGLSSAHTNLYVQIITSNRTYTNQFQRGSEIASDTYGIGLSVLADMDAADTATVHIVVTGGTKIVDITLGGQSTFSGFLAC